jgi:hypothetical protein
MLNNLIGFGKGKLAHPCRGAMDKSSLRLYISAKAPSKANSKANWA